MKKTLVLTGSRMLRTCAVSRTMVPVRVLEERASADVLLGAVTLVATMMTGLGLSRSRSRWSTPRKNTVAGKMMRKKSEV